MNDTHRSERAPLRCRKLDPTVAELMVRTVNGQTDASLNAQFGLSYNTWRKIKSGEPIRASLAARLEQRILRTPNRDGSNGNETSHAD